MSASFVRGEFLRSSVTPLSASTTRGEDGKCYRASDASSAVYASNILTNNSSPRYWPKAFETNYPLESKQRYRVNQARANSLSEAVLFTENEACQLVPSVCGSARLRRYQLSGRLILITGRCLYNCRIHVILAYFILKMGKPKCWSIVS